MRKFAMTTMLVLAASGLSACNRNKAANNSTAANSAAAAPAAPAAVATAEPTDPTAFRAAVAEQCAEAIRANPNAPAGVDLSAVCSCATDATLSGRADAFAFSQTPEGQQVFNQALNQCLQQSGEAPAADGPGAEDEEGKE